MELLVLLFLMLFVAPLTFVVWVVVRIGRLDRRLDELSTLRIGDLGRRVEELARRAEELRERLARLEAARSAAAGPAAPVETGEAAAGSSGAPADAARDTGVRAGSEEPAPDAGRPEEATPDATSPDPPVGAPPPGPAAPARPSGGGATPPPAPPRTTPLPRPHTATPPPAPRATTTPPGSPPPSRRRGLDLEARIGGDWLNKLGVLVTVVGMALGLGYSFRYLGPAGRVALCLAAGLAMLAGGVALERRARYRTFGRGLIGGGWAAVYVTAWAAHALPAARVIPSPFLGAALLMAVAVGMVAHSLRYRSEAVTGTAFLVAFATLAITPLARFSALAAIPLAVAMAWLARRWRWPGLALLAVVGTYGVYTLSSASLPRTGAPWVDLASGQATLLVYWLLFEVVDLTWRGTIRWPGGGRLAGTSPLMVLNALGFCGVSLLQWSGVGAGMVSRFTLVATVLYTVAAVVRDRWPTVGRAASHPAAPGDPSGTAAGADRGGEHGVGGGDLAADAGATDAPESGFDAAITVAAVMAALTLLQRYTGARLTFALVLESQVLLVAGSFMGRAWLQGLGCAVFTASWLKLLQLDVLADGVVSVAGIDLRAWTPVALVMAAAAHADRWLVGLAGPARDAVASPSRTRGPLPLAADAFTWVGTAAVALVLAAELPWAWIEIAWLALAVALVAAGRAGGRAALRHQGEAVGVLAYGGLLVLKVVDLGPGEVLPWATLLPATLLAHGLAVWVAARGSWTADAQPGSGPGAAAVGPRETRFLALASAGGGLVTALGFLLHALPGVAVAPAWAVYGLGLLTVALWAGSRGAAAPAASGAVHGLRAGGLVVLVLSFVRALARDLDVHTGTAIAAVAVVALLLHGAARVARRDAAAPRVAVPALDVLGLLLVASLLASEVSGSLLTVAWALQAVALLVAGFPLRERTLRLAGLGLLATCVVKVFVYDLGALEMPFRILSFIVLGLLMLAASFLYSRSREHLKDYF